MDTGGNRGVMDHLKVTGMLEEVSRGNDQLGKERRKGKVFQVSPTITLLTWHVINHAVLRCHVYIRSLAVMCMCDRLVFQVSPAHVVIQCSAMRYLCSFTVC